jgi:hypothetical protein
MPDAYVEGRILPRTRPSVRDQIRPLQSRRSPAFLRRRENAATAPAPNSTIIDGSGTWVPELEPCELEPCELEPWPEDEHL